MHSNIEYDFIIVFFSLKKKELLFTQHSLVFIIECEHELPMISENCREQKASIWNNIFL